MKREINKENGIVQTGNRYRLKRLMERAKSGERLCIAFIGGSITQGCLATVPEKCYAYLVYQWWKDTFPQADFVYLNAGIGATTSEFAAARVDADLLKHDPDFVIVEFSVNDESNDHFLETYEGLVRKVLRYKSEPALLLLHNVFYATGANAQLQHGKIGRHYDLPAISMQSSIYQELLSGRLANREITSDDLHPNDEGHALIASVITYFLEKTVSYLEKIADEKIELPAPLTNSAYEHSKRYDNRNTDPVCEGFQKDESFQKDITDCFKHGWTADHTGDGITFFVEGTAISVQYRKSVKKPAPTARVVIDDNMEAARLLDANFTEDWGDLLELEMVGEQLVSGVHKVEVTLTEVPHDNAVPFYLTGIITAGNT